MREIPYTIGPMISKTTAVRPIRLDKWSTYRMMASAISNGPRTSSASAVRTFSRLPARIKLPIPHSANPRMPHVNDATEMCSGSVASSTAPFKVMDAVIVFPPIAAGGDLAGPRRCVQGPPGRADWDASTDGHDRDEHRIGREQNDALRAPEGLPS